MTPRIEVRAAPAAIASSDSSIRSASGGNASASASATCVRTVGVVRQPAGDAEDEQRRRDRREQRREGQTVRQQAARGAHRRCRGLPGCARPAARRGSARAAPEAWSASRASAAEVLEQDGLEVLGADASWARRRARGPQPRRTNRRPPSLMLWSRPGARPATDRRGRELDVGGGEDLGRLARG